MLMIMIRFALAAGLLSSLLISGRTAVAEDQPKYYLSLGDSVALGVGASDTFNSYANRLTAVLQGPYTGAFAFGRNMAISGETSASMINDGQLADTLSQIDNPDNDAAVVTLSIGGDDLLELLRPGQPCFEPSSPACPPAIQAALTTFSTNFAKILDDLNVALAADGGQNRLLVMTYYNPFSGTGNHYETAMDGILLGTDGRIDCAATGAALGLNDRIACIGAAKGARVVDVYPLFEGKGSRLTHIDALDIHPNDRGYDVITGAFLAQLGFGYLPFGSR